MFDQDGKIFVAEAASPSGFVAPNVNRTIDDMPPDVAIRIMQAGDDQIPGIN